MQRKAAAQLVSSRIAGGTGRLLLPGVSSCCYSTWGFHARLNFLKRSEVTGSDCATLVTSAHFRAPSKKGQHNDCQNGSNTTGNEKKELKVEATFRGG